MPNALKPLLRRTALLACSEMKSQHLASGLAALGAEVRIFPAIEIREIADKRALDMALDHLDKYAWIIFTSAYGVRFFLDRMADRGIDMGRCHGLQVCAVGPATAAVLENRGVRVTLMPRDYVAEGILAALQERQAGLSGLAGIHILLPRARQARDLLPDALAKNGALVETVACYETVLPAIDRDQVQHVLRRPPDLMVFTSSSAVRNFITILGGEGARRVFGRSMVAALGPVTARTLAACGKKPEIQPRENTIPSLLEAIGSCFQALPAV
jgi:uroporphyrinogen III methyltransferase/synthase